MLKRYLETQIRSDLKEKMVFIGGPRQSGKTTVAKKFGPEDSYLNWDYPKDREHILKLNLPSTDIWILDEIHKYKNWRNLLKGLYDKNKGQKDILVTGSARLDLLRRGGDSLQGRYHFLRLYPLTLDELSSHKQSDLEDLFQLGGFPEPFLLGSKKASRRWSQEYRSRILQEDIGSVELIEDLGKAELLLINLPQRVSSPLSVNSLREDLDVSHRAVSRWLNIFEKFYAIFMLNPFGAKGLRVLKKEKKHYHFDWTVIENEGARFECMMALHLLKRVHFLNDSEGMDYELCYFRDSTKREVDFVVSKKKKPILFVEAKLSQVSMSPDLRYLKRKFTDVPAYQIHFRDGKDYVNAEEGIEFMSAQRFLSEKLSLILK
jgi:predicted AAA+ superfamily ATPase